MTPQPHSPHIGGRPGKLPAPRTALLAGALLAILGTMMLAGCGTVAAPGSAAAGGASAGGTAGGSTAGGSTAGSGAPAGGTASSSPSPSPSPTVVSAAKVDLTVTFAGTGDSSGLGSWTLRCDPPGGTTRHPAAACASITSSPQLLFPGPTRKAVCPMIMANAGAVNVAGTYFGKKVHEQIVDGGCDIGRWNQLKKIFA